MSDDDFMSKLPAEVGGSDGKVRWIVPTTTDDERADLRAMVDLPDLTSQLARIESFVPREDVPVTHEGRPIGTASVTELGEITMELTEYGADRLRSMLDFMGEPLSFGVAPATTTPGGERMDMDTYYELRFEDDTEPQEVRDVTSLEGAKAVAKSVRGVTGKPVQLVKITPVDIDAPARTRATSAD